MRQIMEGTDKIGMLHYAVIVDISIENGVVSITDSNVDTVKNTLTLRRCAK